MVFTIHILQLVFAMVASFFMGAFFFHKLGKLRGKLDILKEIKPDIKKLVEKIEFYRTIIDGQGDGWKI